MRRKIHNTKNKSFRILLFLMQFIALGLFAQSPSLINYQGTARLADGTPLDNRTISIKFEILEGSASGTPVASETQTLQTNALGLFSTLIGQSANLSSINWQGNPMFLRVGLDTSAGTSFVELGTQRLVSVPYAIQAASVPSSYTNNILSIGNSTYALSPTVAVTPNATITVSGLGTVTSIGTNSFDINIPAPTFTGQGATTVNGAYPNYTISSATPSIALTSVAAAGLSVTSSGSSFSLNVPLPTFTNVGPATITGAYPNFTINSSTGTTYTNGTGIGLTSGSVIVNTSPNITPTVAVTTTAAAGASVASSGSSFSLNVPPPTFTNAGPSTITGAYPNFTINSSTGTTYTNGTGIGLTSGSVIVNTSPNITPTVAVTTTAAAGASVASSGSSFSLNVPPPTFTNAGPSTITGTYPNYTINSTSAPSYTSGTGISITSGSINNTAPDQTVTFNNTGQTLITGTYPTFSISTPTVANTSIVLTASAAAGPSLSTSGTNSFNINIPPASGWALLGNAGTSAASDFIGTTDNVALNFRVFNQKSGTIDHVLFNTSLGYQSLNSVSTGTGNTALGYRSLNSLTTSQRNTGIGANALGSVTTGNQNTALGALALQNVTTGGNNIAIGYSALRLNNSINNVAIGSLALELNTTGNSNVAIGLSAMGTNAAGNYNTAIGHSAGSQNNGAQNVFLGYSSGAQSSGTGNVFLGYQSGFFETGSNKLYIANSTTSVSPLLYGDFTSGHLAIGTTTANGELQFNNTINGRKIVLWEGGNNDHQVYGIGTNVNVLRYQVDASVADHVFYSGINSTSSKELMRITGTGSVGIGTSSPATNLHVNSTSNSTQVRLTHTATATFGLVLGTTNLSSGLLNYDNTPLFFGTNGANRMVISNTGAVGIGTISPAATLHVNGTMRLVEGNQAAGKVLTSDASGNATWQTPSSGGWGFTGNIGTTAGTNFIGTTDAQDLVFKTNSNEVFRATTAGNYIFSPSNTGATSTQTLYTPGKTTNINGNPLMIKGGSAGTGGSATSGGNLILEGGDGWHINSFSYLMGGIILRTGKNLGVGSGNQNGGIIKFDNYNGSNTLYEMARFDISGNFGLGVTTPAYQLELSQNSAGKPTSNVWTTTSDARLKTNVHDYKDGLKELMKINPVWFTYTGEANMPRETGVGIIAQDLQKIAPYMVKDWLFRADEKDSGTTYLGVDNGPMTYMLINAVKEQQQQIEKQQKQIDELKAVVDELLNK